MKPFLERAGFVPKPHIRAVNESHALGSAAAREATFVVRGKEDRVEGARLDAAPRAVRAFLA